MSRIGHENQIDLEKYLTSLSWLLLIRSHWLIKPSYSHFFCFHDLESGTDILPKKKPDSCYSASFLVMNFPTSNFQLLTARVSPSKTICKSSFYQRVTEDPVVSTNTASRLPGKCSRLLGAEKASGRMRCAAHLPLALTSLHYYEFLIQAFFRLFTLALFCFLFLFILFFFSRRIERNQQWQWALI